jgi:hypothetical protein
VPESLESYTRKLPLSVTESDGRVELRCDGNGCVQRWPLTSEDDGENGTAFGNAVRHALTEHV